MSVKGAFDKGLTFEKGLRIQKMYDGEPSGLSKFETCSVQNSLKTLAFIMIDIDSAKKSFNMILLSPFVKSWTGKNQNFPVFNIGINSTVVLFHFDTSSSDQMFPLLFHPVQKFSRYSLCPITLNFELNPYSVL